MVSSRIPQRKQSNKQSGTGFLGEGDLLRHHRAAGKILRPGIVSGERNTKQTRERERERLYYVSNFFLSHETEKCVSGVGYPNERQRRSRYSVDLAVFPLW